MAEQQTEETTEPQTTEQVESADQPDAPENTLGDPGKKALDAERQARREAEKRAKRADDLEAELNKLREQQMSEQEKAINTARDEARREAETEFARERLTDRIRVAAARRLNDPEDAVRLLDLDGIDPSAENVTSAIEEQIGQLIESKPYLAVTSATPSGSTDAGSRQTPPQERQLTREDLKSMTPQQINDARAKGQLNELMGVKT